MIILLILTVINVLLSAFIIITELLKLQHGKEYDKQLIFVNSCFGMISIIIFIIKMVRSLKLIDLNAPRMTP